MRDGEHKKLLDMKFKTRFQNKQFYCFVVGIDNMINLAHGIEHVGFLYFGLKSNAEYGQHNISCNYVFQLAIL